MLEFFSLHRLTKHVHLGWKIEICRMLVHDTGQNTTRALLALWPDRIWFKIDSNETWTVKERACCASDRTPHCTAAAEPERAFQLVYCVARYVKDACRCVPLLFTRRCEWRRSIDFLPPRPVPSDILICSFNYPSMLYISSCRFAKLPKPFSTLWLFSLQRKGIPFESIKIAFSVSSRVTRIPVAELKIGLVGSLVCRLLVIRRNLQLLFELSTSISKRNVLSNFLNFFFFLRFLWP